MKNWKVLVALVVVVIAGLNCSKGLPADVKDFTLESLNGKTYTLSSLYSEKPVLMVFWTTWCPYCVEEIPTLKELTSTYGEKVYIIGINLQEDPKRLQRFAEKRKINYPILLDTTGKVARSYGVQGIPLNIVVDTKGNIVYRGHSVEEAKEKLLGLI